MADNDLIPSDSDTPPPRRTKSDAEIRLPIDPDWFHEFRRETKKGITEIKRDMNAQERQIQDVRLNSFKHDEQIRVLASDLAETDQEVGQVSSRVTYLEKVETGRAEAERIAQETQAKQIEAQERSLMTKIRDTAVLSVVAGLIGGLGLFIWFLFTLFVKKDQS